MEDKIVEWVVLLAEKVPFLVLPLGILGTLVVLATVVVGLTKTTKDDEALAKLKAIPVLGAVFRAAERFALIEAKKKPE